MNAAEQYKKAIPVGTLVKDDFQVEIAFSLRKNTSGGIDFEIFGVEVEGSGELESTVFHKIALTFKSV